MAVLLDVPYFSQLNPSDGALGWRQCQTSSVAMCLAFMKVRGIKDDTDYLRIVQKYGDTTDANAHKKALAQLNIMGKFSQTLSPDDLKASLDRGFPCAIGILHHGPVNDPGGGGHWICVRGYDNYGWQVHDPYGDLDLVTGRWLRTSPNAGRGLRYSYRNTNPRWIPEGPGHGWGWLFG